MRYSSSFVCASLVSILFGCAHAPPCPETASTAAASSPETSVPIAIVPEAPGELVVAQKTDEKIAPASAAVYLRIEMDERTYGKERVTALTEGLKSALSKKKFDVRAASAGAYSQLTVSSFEDDVLGTRGVALVWGVRRSGQRPKRWVQQSFTVKAPIEAVWTKLHAKILESFAALEIEAPTTPAKIGADPACAPRFGFETDERNRVTAVLAKSPAQRAGLKIGDVILAVDSSMPRWNRPVVDDDVYVKRLSVPLKVDRQGTVVRTQVRPENLCE